MLEFLDFNIRSDSSSYCSVDSVTIYDGPSTSDPLLGVHCGSRTPAPRGGSKTEMLIVFSTGPLTPFTLVLSGFQARFGEYLSAGRPIQLN